MGQQPEITTCAALLGYRVNNQQLVQYPKIERIMNHVSHRKEALAKELAHQRCAKIFPSTT